MMIFLIFMFPAHLFVRVFCINLMVETPSGHKNLFTTILSGTPALAESVRRYESLQRRVQLAWALSPFDERQTSEYVRHHILVAGGNPGIFTPDALRAIHAYTGGIPRNINNLCDTALMIGFAGRATSVTPDLVAEAALDTCLANPVEKQQ